MTPLGSRLTPAGRRLAVAAGAVVLLLVALVICSVAITWRFFSQKPDTEASPAKAAAGARWAGMAEPEDLTVVALEHNLYMEDSWRVTWTGTRDATDQLLRSARSTTALEACALREDVYGIGLVALTDCQKLADHWRMPDGNGIERTIVRGVLPDGRAVVTLVAIDF